MYLLTINYDASAYIRINDVEAQRLMHNRPFVKKEIPLEMKWSEGWRENAYYERQDETGYSIQIYPTTEFSDDFVKYW